MADDTVQLATVDPRLREVLASANAGSIADVIGIMTRMDEILPNGDGLKWFNLLYLKVTEAVQVSHDGPNAGGWSDLAWLEQLDVVFGQFYFDALKNWLGTPGETPRAWQPLFKSRRMPGIARVQFALAGMNAHINHDLMIALVRTGEEQGKRPRHGSPQHRDFERVNDLLEAVMAEVKAFLATGIVGEVDQHLGTHDDLIAMWSVRKARETAWDNAEALWGLRRFPLFRDNFIRGFDRMTELVSQGLLTPTA